MTLNLKGEQRGDSALSGSLPDTLYDLTALRFLYLAYAPPPCPAPRCSPLLRNNNLHGTISEKLGQLVNLETLYAPAPSLVRCDALTVP